MSFIYLACPYTNPSLTTREARVRMASIAAGVLMVQGHVVYSPISHGFLIEPHVPDEVAFDHGFWMAQCQPFMQAAACIVVLPLFGWAESKGVVQELKYFQGAGKPIKFLRKATWGSLDGPTDWDLVFWGGDVIDLDAKVMT